MCSLSLFNANMRSIDDIRRSNIRRLEQEYGSLKALADKIERSESQVSQWKNGAVNSGTGKPRGMRSETARFIELATERQEGWLDRDHDASDTAAENANEIANTTPGPSIKGVYPLISKVQAGMWSGLCEQFQPHHAQEWLPSTKNLGRCGYMLRVDGKSMENPSGRHNFAEGMVLHVNPDLTPDPGQYVVVRRNGTQEATFKRYVLIDGEKYLEAINPDWPKDMKYLPLQPGDEWCGVVVDASLGGLI